MAKRVSSKSVKVCGHKRKIAGKKVRVCGHRRSKPTKTHDTDSTGPCRPKTAKRK